MSVTVAKTAGFCFGVRRAVELAEQQAKQNGTIWAYGEIIHNMHEIRRLESRGVRTAQTLEEIPDGARVLIRAHGVPRAVYDTLADKGCEVYDATCPFVQKIHRIADEREPRGQAGRHPRQRRTPRGRGHPGLVRGVGRAGRRGAGAGVRRAPGERRPTGLYRCADHGQSDNLEYFCRSDKKKVYKPQNF